MKYALLSLVLVAEMGCAFGQSTGPGQGAVLMHPNTTTLTVPTCSDTVTFGKSSKLIKDIFPEECGMVTGQPITAGTQIAIRVVPGKHADTWMCSTNGSSEHVCSYQELLEVVNDPALEPVDVPAITKKHLLHQKGEGWDCGTMACFATEDVYDDIPTCADKRRILLTTENGDKWCHKPQP